jgi:uridine kinase
MHQIYRPLGLIYSDLLSERLFQIGILIKIIFVIAFIPTLQQEWFVPFIVNWIEDPTTLPWTGHLLSGGDKLAFPYGIIMFIVNLPAIAIGWAIDNFFAIKYFTGMGFRFTLFGADILLLLILLQAFEDQWKKILIFYWLSPIVLFITYWHGQTDIIPVVLFFYALILIKKGNYWLAGIILACSIASKHSMVIGAPFIIMYLWSHNGINKELQRFLAFFIGSLVLVEVPFIFSNAFRMMVLNNREVGNLYWLFVEMGTDIDIFLIPIFYMFLLYFFWRIRRINFDLFMAVMGVSFSIVILLSPSPPGWYLWLVPFFTLLQSRYGYGAVATISIFSFFFLSYHLLYSSGSDSILFHFSSLDIPLFQNSFIKSFHYTLMVGLGLLITIQILREGIRENDYYRLGNKPLTIGISGDSGVGKTTFSKGLASIFGEDSLAKVSGDDYHNWERSSPMWKTQTHLDPKANRLFELVRDVQSLINGEVVKARQYDHSSGRFVSQKINKNKNIIIVEGLHTLYPKQLLQEFDVSFFIEMDESLRLFFRVKRDTEERGHSKKSVLHEIEKRKADSQKYIKPQSERANVIFTLLPINIELFEQEQIIESNIKLKVCIKNGIYYQKLVRILIGICGLQVNIDSINKTGEVILEISGDVLAEDIDLTVNMLVPNIAELFDFGAKFSGGVYGIMQIITFMEIDEALKSRNRSV